MLGQVPSVELNSDCLTLKLVPPTVSVLADEEGMLEEFM